MMEKIILFGIFILAFGYFTYKLFPKKNNGCGCEDCNYTKEK